MKQTKWFCAALAAVLLSACSNEAIEKAPQASDAIQFGVFTNRSSQMRAGVTDLTAVQSSGFKVVAYSTNATAWASFTPPTTDGQLFMGSIASGTLTPQNVTYGTAWTYSPVKYWPINSGKISFFAYNTLSIVDKITPASGIGARPTLEVTIPNTVADQKDLVADQLIDQTSSTNSGKVNFTFTHLLSKIGFQAKTSANLTTASSTVTVNELKIKFTANKVPNKGTYTFNSTTGIGDWSVTAASSSAAISNTGEVLNTSNVTVPNDGTSYQQLNDANKFLMLLPNALVQGDLKIDLKYTITTSGEAVQYTCTDIDLAAFTPVKGNQYVYKLTITTDAVVFEGIGVSGWDNGTDPTQDL
jgi:hypothetical protein